MECAAVLARESSTVTWVVLWTDLRTVCDLYRAKAYRVNPVSNVESSFFDVAYDRSFWKDFSKFDSLHYRICKAVRRLEDMRFLKTFQGRDCSLLKGRDWINFVDLKC